MSGQRDAVAAGDLARFGCAVLEAVGVRPADAAEVVETLVDADLRGLDSHGVVARLPSYVERIRRGGVDVTAEVEVVGDHGAVAVLDAADGLGQVAALAATREAVARAREHGVGVVAVRRSNHLGAVGYYARRIAQVGLVGLVITGSGPRIAPWGSAEPLLGTNPLAIAAPSGDGPAMVIDVSGGAVLTGAIDRAAAAGEPIPDTWALDGDGVPTTDPHAALGGSVLPYGGAKSGALLLALEVMTSVLTGAHYGRRIPDLTESSVSQGLGHLVIALAPDRFGPPDRFEQDVAELLGWVRTSRPVRGGEPVRVPGDRGEAVAARRAVHGIPLRGPRRVALEELGRRVDVELGGA